MPIKLVGVALVLFSHFRFLKYVVQTSMLHFRHFKVLRCRVFRLRLANAKRAKTL